MQKKSILFYAVIFPYLQATAHQPFANSADPSSLAPAELKCDSLKKTERSFDISENNFPPTISLFPGESILIFCKGRPSTGYSWYIQNSDDIPSHIIKISGGARIIPTKSPDKAAVYKLGSGPVTLSSEKKLIGGLQESYVKITADKNSKNHKAIIRFVYKQLWMPENGSERTITFHIKKN